MALGVFALLVVKNREQLKGVSEEVAVDYGSREQQVRNGVPRRK